MDYKVIAYYVIKEVENPAKELKSVKRFLETLDSSGRIYIGEEGVNAQFSVHVDALEDCLTWFKNQPLHSCADIKIHDWHEHPFAKLSVKYRKQIVAMDMKLDPANRAKHISSNLWREFLEERDENTIVVDVRNKYESDIGHFDGAILPPLTTFREFPAFVQSLKDRYDVRKTRVLMYCTGGIRCEFFSPLMKEAGFENVFQLKGGVLKYGLEEGCTHWRGKLFVFDDRMVVPISEGNDETIGSCLFCDTKSDTFYNCANMDCNDLFVACTACASEKQGCCSGDCLEVGRVRPFIRGERPKPFRKLDHDEKVALSTSQSV